MKKQGIPKKLFFISLLIVHCTLYIEHCLCQWYQINLPITGQIVRMQFADSNNGWIYMWGGTLLGTTNSGLNWQIFADSSSNVYYFQFFNNQLGYATGNNNLIKTTNGGHNWFNIYNPPSPYVFGGFYFISPNTGWSEASYFPFGVLSIFRTTDGCQSFENIYTRNDNTANADFKIKMFYDQNTSQYCGYHSIQGCLWRTTNSGYNWIQLNFIELGDVSSFSFLNKDTGYVVYFPNVANNSRIFYTSNGGQNWNQSYFNNLNYSLGLIQAVTNNKVWCGSGFNYILVSTNGGYTWGNQPTPVSSNSYIYMFDTSLGFAWGGLYLLRTTNGGGPIMQIANKNEQIANQYKLFQNYPNPFNQFSIIKVQCTIKSHIKLAVYDISGKEIAILLNEIKSQGKYEIRFDGGNLASGVYFYSLYANDRIIDTKKLILLK